MYRDILTIMPTGETLLAFFINITENIMKLSERQMKTLDNVKLNYGQLCNKRTLRSLERKGLIQWHISTGWSLTYLGVEELNKITL